jgi:hypothetical protein
MKGETMRAFWLRASLGFAVLGSLLAVAVAQDGSKVARPPFAFSAKRAGKETKLKIHFEGGKIARVTAAEGKETRNFVPVEPGGKLTQPCSAEERTCENVTLEDGRVVRVCTCKNAGVALLLSAVQKVREAGGGGGGGNYCTEAKPCCWEDQKLQMSVCYP